MNWVRKALTRTIKHERIQGKQHLLIAEPSDKLVLAVEFAIVVIALFAALEIVHIIVFHAWNAEVFSALVALSGTVMGIFIGKKT